MAADFPEAGSGQPGTDSPAASSFDTRSAILHAAGGDIEAWVHRYLTSGPWANPAFSEGLKKAPRWWRGPVPISLDSLVPALGPDERFEYPVQLEDWRARTGEIAAGLEDPLDVPPLIVEYRSGELSLRDGNHRYGAMQREGWKDCWALIWYNSAEDYAQHRIELKTHIRVCQKKDLAELEWFGLISPFQETILEAFRRQKEGEVIMLVAESAGFPIGQVWLDLVKRTKQKTGVIWALRVLHTVQKMGIGTRLIAGGEDRLREKGFRFSELIVENDNPNAKRLYERLGYSVFREAVDVWSFSPPEGERVRVVSEGWMMRKGLD